MNILQGFSCSLIFCKGFPAFAFSEKVFVVFNVCKGIRLGDCSLQMVNDLVYLFIMKRCVPTVIVCQN